MALVWAKISDRLGRKPVLLIGVFGGSISAVAFGLSRNLWMALGARAFGGLINPNVGVVSAFVGELVKSKDDQGDYTHPIEGFLLLELTDPENECRKSILSRALP